MDTVNQQPREESSCPPSYFSAPRLTPDDHEDHEISVIDVMVALAQQKGFILTVTICCAFLAAIISLCLRNEYTATVTLMPPQQTSSLSGALAAQLGGLSSAGSLASLAGGNLLKNPNEIYVSMLRSHVVEDGMVQRFGLMQEYHKDRLSDTRKVFEKQTAVDAAAKDSLIHISVTDRDPNRAAELANGYVEQFRQLSQHLAITEAGQRRIFFEQQMHEAKDKLADAEEVMKKTEQSTGLIQIDSQARALIESVTYLRAQIATREVEAASIRTFATAQNSQLVQIEQELNSLREQLAKLGGDGDSSSAGVIVPKGRVPQASLEYVRQLREVKFHEAVFEILARQFEAAKLDESRQGAMIQIVDPATVPDRKSGPIRSVIVLGATAAAFFLGIVLSMLRVSLGYALGNVETAKELHRLRDALAFGRPRKQTT